MTKRRVVAPAGHGIAASRGSNTKTLSLSFFGETVRLRVLAIQDSMGRDWFPGGLYILPGPGSTPGRSIDFNITKTNIN